MVGPGEQLRAAGYEQKKDSRSGSSSTAGSHAAPLLPDYGPAASPPPDGGGDTDSDGIVTNLPRGASRPAARWVIHLHVDATLLQLVEHLLDVIASSLEPSSASDPGEIVVPLMERALLVELHHTALLELRADVVRHLLFRSPCHNPILRGADRAR